MALNGIPVSTINLSATAFEIKGNGEADVIHLNVKNDGEAKVYVKLYDKATAPTHADTPVWRMPFDAGEGMNGPCTLNFSLGAWARAVTEAADSGTTSPASNAVFFNAAHTRI